MLAHGRGIMFLSTKDAPLMQCLHTGWILPQLLKAPICHNLFKEKTERSWQIFGQQSGKAVLTGLEWCKDLVLHHVVQHTELPQLLADVSKSVDMQRGIAYTVAAGANQLNQDQSQLLRQAP
jgi:hypothetical protein